VVSGFHKLPLYIRYFTCEGKDGKIIFYEDIYDEDRNLIQKYFANKSVFKLKAKSFGEWSMVNGR
jgi:murein L,D-transpeptidase YcbB/YkuD